MKLHYSNVLVLLYCTVTLVPGIPGLKVNLVSSPKLLWQNRKKSATKPDKTSFHSFTPPHHPQNMFKSFKSSGDEYGRRHDSESDEEEDEFAATPIAKLFSSGDLRQKKFKKKKDDVDDNDSIASNESGWSITSADILDEIDNFRNPTKRQDFMQKKYTKVIRTDVELHSEVVSCGSGVQLEVGSEEVMASPSPPPLPPQMAKARALEEAKRNRGLSKWAILRQNMKPDHRKKVNSGLSIQMRKVVEAAKLAADRDRASPRGDARSSNKVPGEDAATPTSGRGQRAGHQPRSSSSL